VGDVRREGAGAVGHQARRAHPRHVLDDLMGVEVIGPRLIRAVGVIPDHEVESQLGPMVAQRAPGALRQRRRIEAVEERGILRLDGVTVV
jgi:hypothetical protein